MTTQTQTGTDVLVGVTDPFAREVADRVVFMDGDLIVESGRPEQVIGVPWTAGRGPTTR